MLLIHRYSTPFLTGHLTLNKNLNSYLNWFWTISVNFILKVLNFFWLTEHYLHSLNINSKLYLSYRFTFVIPDTFLVSPIPSSPLQRLLLYWSVNPLKPELNPICYLLALLGAHHFSHVSRIRVKLLTFRRLMSYIYGAPILDVSRSHTTTQHSR